jgi:Tfp pilus assembly protein PilP
MMRVGTYAVRFLALGAVLIGAAVVHAQQEAGDARQPGKDADNPAATDNAAKPRDPFRPFMLDLRLRPDRLIPQTPLQHYDLGQLAVVATVWDVNPPRAMVEDSGGMGYIVSLGTPIGSSGGIVTAIEPQRIIVEERVLDYYGKEQVNRIVMETPKEEGPNQAARERQ